MGNPVFNARLKAVCLKHAKGEPERRKAWIDGLLARNRKRKVRMFPGGSLFIICAVPGYDLYEGERTGKRGKCKGFSPRSRRRLLIFMATLNRHAPLPLFITLTYPEWWPSDWHDWKDQLDDWAHHHLERRFPGCSFVWKLEPQQRGAPHFHLILFGRKFIPHQWVAETWYKVVGSNDERHLRAGVQVTAARSWNGVMCYAGKKYLGKDFVAPLNWREDVGRYWGCYGRKHLPKSEEVEFEISERALFRVHRVLRAFMRSKGIEWTTRGGVTLFTQQHFLWFRVIEWAETGQTHGVDHSLSLAAQPF
jgi:hypothetical protein